MSDSLKHAMKSWEEVKPAPAKADLTMEAFYKLVDRLRKNSEQHLTEYGPGFQYKIGGVAVYRSDKETP